MKKLPVSFSLLAGVRPLSARQVQVVAPEFSGIIPRLGADLSAALLEKQNAPTGSEARVAAARFGLANAKGMNLLDKGRSPGRAEAGENLRLLVKADGNSRDPDQTCVFS